MATTSTTTSATSPTDPAGTPVPPPAAPSAPTAPTAAGCGLCDDTGWADPWEVHDGAPSLTWCDACLGAGLDGCAGCDGAGVVPEPAPCPCVTGELDGVPLAA